MQLGSSNSIFQLFEPEEILKKSTALLWCFLSRWLQWICILYRMSTIQSGLGKFMNDDNVRLWQWTYKVSNKSGFSFLDVVSDSNLRNSWWKKFESMKGNPWNISHRSQSHRLKLRGKSRIASKLWVELSWRLQTLEASMPQSERIDVNSVNRAFLRRAIWLLWALSTLASHHRRTFSCYQFHARRCFIIALHEHKRIVNYLNPWAIHFSLFLRLVSGWNEGSTGTRKQHTT